MTVAPTAYPRKPATPRVSKTACDTSEIVALLRKLREEMGIFEELEPDNRMLREYQYMRGWAIIELRRIRALVELDLERRVLTAQNCAREPISNARQPLDSVRFLS